MALKKTLKRYGDSKIIRFTPEEIKLYNLEEGKEINVGLNEDIEIVKKIEAIDDKVNKLLGAQNGN